MTYSFEERSVSDLHKDARSHRPCALFWAEWDSATDDGKQAIWDGLCLELEQSIAEDRAREEAAVAQFEQTIAFLLESGAADRAAAIRWYLQGMNLGDTDLAYGGSYVCFELGLPYSMAAQFDPITKAMLGDKSIAEIFA